MIAFVVQIVNTIVVIGLVIAYYCYWLPSYNMNPGIDLLLDVKHWKNSDCDEHFSNKIRDNNFTIINYPDSSDENSFRFQEK